MAPVKISKRRLSALSKSLKERVLSKDEIIETLYEGLHEVFGFSGVAIELLDPVHYSVKYFFPKQQEYWCISDREREWLIKHTKELLIRNPENESVDYVYIQDRRKFLYTDLEQWRKDTKHFDQECSDSLFLVLISEDELILGLVHIQDWGKGRKLTDIELWLPRVREFVKDAVLALDNLFIHQKIESLISDKNQLKQRIQKDEEDLKRRVLELTVLYDTSNALGYSLSYSQIVNLMMDSLFKVLHFDAGSIFLLDFVPGGEIITRVNSPMGADFISAMQANVVVACTPFLRRQVEFDRIRITTNFSIKSNVASRQEIKMKSFANVPLIFKEEMLGMLNVCSISENAFARNEMTFLHTMANQLASHLGRLKLVKKLEKSKIGSLIDCMAEGVVMFDENQNLEIINPTATHLLGLDPSLKVEKEEIYALFRTMGIYTLVQQCIQEERNFLNYDVVFENKNLVLNLTKVMDGENHKVGTVLVFRDATELHRASRIKTQRLEVISRLNMIIKSIADLNNLLTVVLEFILTISGTEMGAIQIKHDQGFVTRVHSNFPDKIFRHYRFSTGEVITDFVIRTQEMVFIEDYYKHPGVDTQTKITLEDYLCLPILVKNDLIGLLHLARKVGDEGPRISQDDIETVATITPLIGTAIHNAMLYQETLEKQKLDQELKVANEIQTKLLPEAVPQLEGFSFGAISIPARKIGGDYYDFILLPDGTWGVVIADIVGKGIPAGLYMAMLKSILHTHLVSMASPKEALIKINELLYRDPVIHKFVPLFYGILDPKAKTFLYANAGHEPALLYSSGQFFALDTSGLPLGGMEDSPFEEKQLHLKDDDWLLFFTDGLVEARNDAGDEFGALKFQDHLKSTSSKNAADFVSSVHEYLQDGGYMKKQHDDLTLVAIKVGHTPEVLPPLETHKMKISSAKKNVKVVRDWIEVIAHTMGFVDSDVHNIKLAVNEAQANVIEHAYSGSDDGKIVITAMVYSDRLEILIRDFGPGIANKTIKSEAEHLGQLEGSGLGMYLIQTYMDHVEYTQHPIVGTELLLVKKLNEGEKHADC